MKHLILLITAIAYTHVCNAAGTNGLLLQYFPDGITPATVSKVPSGSASDTSTDTEKTEFFEEEPAMPGDSSDSKTSPVSQAASGAGNIEELRALTYDSLERRLLRRKLIRIPKREGHSMSARKVLESRHRRPKKRSVLPVYPGKEKAVPPVARTWADVSDDEKEALDLYLENPPEPLSRTQEYRAEFPIPPIDPHDYPTDYGAPVAECPKAYSDYYTAHPQDESRLFVEWPPTPELDGKEPGWYWGVTNTGRLFLYFGGEDVVKAASHAIRNRPRASDPSWALS